MASYVSTGQKWAQSEKEYIHSDWTSDTKIWMVGVQGGDIFVRKRIFLIFDYVKNCLKTATKMSFPSYWILKVLAVKEWPIKRYGWRLEVNNIIVPSA